MSEYLGSYISHFKKIVKNEIRCNSCFDVIGSTSLHDYRVCKCGKVSIDGGLEYLKRSYKDPTDYQDLSTNRKFTIEEFDDLITKYTHESRRYPVYSDTFYHRSIEAAKYYKKLWYPTNFNNESEYENL